MSYSPQQSPGRIGSPKRSPKKEVTRYGPVKFPDTKFGEEERFMWQKSKSTNDVAYDLPEMKMSRSIVFSQALRKGMDEENPDNKKRSTGPGSYEYSGCYDHLSEYAVHAANRFPCAARQSMAQKTPSPGAVYNIEKTYNRGHDKANGIGFPNASRRPLFHNSAGANADMFIPKPDYGPAITMAGRNSGKKYFEAGTPGCVYDVHVSYSFSSLSHLIMID